ncbi:MAG: superoxide dismutase [Bacteroidetes bacterium GWF2_43_63]|nr:MAG: superoxide dismutase [Bacteroidetes bacterium GWE2_42_42]OFY52947.1 MAG: superoxide dismutase [Bacteroidetes bacterium GWF2_43_63]HBG70157.1 superoxide dismutase [Bacteroidales bacterium]HCB62236.1 superoxide dismutase [Bacteroidales bacterium]
MKFELPPLPWAADALEPIISAKTIEFHYGKHHQAYVNNLNNLLPGSPFEKAPLEQIVVEAEGGIFNNAAQVWNHTFYWNCLTPKGGGQPSGDLMDAIVRDFGSFEEFQKQFTQAAATLFGSGWAWLSADEDGKLVITQESNAGNPMRKGLEPLLTCDVWEHAYYLDKQNRRPDYIADFWKLVDWEAVSERY